MSELKFLVVRLSSIGDIVHALPAVAALGDAHPGAEIHWAIEKRFAPLLNGNPYVRRVVRLDTLGWREEPFSPWTLEQFAAATSAMRAARFDAAVDFQGLIKSALISWISNSRQRVGFSEYWLREPVAGSLYTDRVSPHGRRHIIEMNFSLVERLGVPRTPSSQWKFPLPKSEADDAVVQERLAAAGASEFVILNPGGGWKSKCWPPENYAELIRRIEVEIPQHIVLTGSPDEESLIEGILRSAHSRRGVYIPSTLLQLIALARRARLFVGGDTGPVHLAEAAGTPVVSIFSRQEPVNTPERNGPFSHEDISVAGANGVPKVRRSKSADYLRDVPVESVLAAIRERMARSRNAARAHG